MPGKSNCCATTQHLSPAGGEIQRGGSRSYVKACQRVEVPFMVRQARPYAILNTFYSLRSQQRHRFDMVRLRKHVDGPYGLDSEAALDKNIKVARKRLGVA